MGWVQTRRISERKEKRRQENIENIVKKAIEFCRDNESNSNAEVDPVSAYKLGY